MMMASSCSAGKVAGLSLRPSTTSSSAPRRSHVVRAAAGDRKQQRQQQQGIDKGFRAAAVAAAAAAALSLGAVAPDMAFAGTPKGQGVLSTDAYGRTDIDRCSLEALDKAADTRASYSDFAGPENKELYVNVEGCDYSNKDLSKKVLSGIRARGANFSGSTFPAEVSRADFSMATMKGTQIKFSNLYNTIFAGADLEGATLEGALASGAYFGPDAQTGQEANLKGTDFEDTLLAVSDIKKICRNKTLEYEARAVLGC